MTVAQQQFLPDNLMMSLDSCKNVSLINKVQEFPAPSKVYSAGWFTPMFFFSVLLLLMIGLNFPGNNKLTLTARGLENFIFFLTGLLGLLLLLMWVFTDHKMTKENYNLLWAWPLNTILVMVNTRFTWVKRYFLLQGIFLCLTMVAWFFIPQKMSPALIPFVVLLILLSFKRSAKNRK